jgi:hypothetical protein
MNDPSNKILKVPFGSKDGRLVAPTDVLEAGLDCQCTCPGCGADLVLKQGTKRRHFAHHNAPGSNQCVESAIHAAAKQVLVDHGNLMVPAVAFFITAATSEGNVLHERDLLSPQRRIRFDRTVPEVTIGVIRPDVVGYRGERQLLVEMYFRHRVDPDKRDKLKNLGLAALEIDLSDLDPLEGFDGVRARVIDNVQYKEWLVYPRADDHLAYLKHKLAGRVELANQAHLARVRQEQNERARLRQIEKARLAGNVDVDTAFRSWAPEDQAAWLREKLGLTGTIPAFLARLTYPETVLKVPHFLFQASIFEQFIYLRKEGTRLTSRAIYPCLQRRFPLPRCDAQLHHLAINLYLRYLARARFLHESGDDMTGPYVVEHNQVSMPPWTPPETRHDGDPLLPDSARGQGKRREWRANWPRWRAVMDEAREQLACSEHRQVLMDGLDGLSGFTPPPTPHHWAAPLVERGVPLENCLELLEELGLLAD